MGTDLIRVLVALCVLALVAPVGMAQDLERIAVTVPDGRLRPGAAGTLLVAVMDESGEPVADAPLLSSSAGPVRLLGAEAPGTWEYTLNVPIDERQIELSVSLAGRRWVRRLPVWVPPESTLELPRRIDGIAGAEEVSFLVTGENLPPPELLQVVVGEGRVLEVEPSDGGLLVRLAPSDDPFPRNVPVGVRDRRTLEQPIWGALRLRGRPSLPLRSEPGARATLYVGERVYGPFDADAEGLIMARVDQYPGERSALAVFEDDLGNEKSTEVPLSQQTRAQLVAFPGGELVPGASPRSLYLVGFQANGFPWKGEAPTCRTSTADLRVGALSRGAWMVSLPAAASVGAEDLRVDCDLGDGAAVARLRIPVVRGIPARIGLRVWPTELRTDFPFAEVRVVLEDHRGDRIDASDVQIWAEHGSISLEAGGGNEVEGEYDGSEATDQAVDVVRATYTPTPGDGVIEVVTLAWEPVPVAGRAQVQARVLDHRLRPLVSVPVELDAGAEVEVLTTDERGVATGQVRLPEGRGPVELRAQAGVREARAVAIRGGAGRPLTEQGLSSQADLVLSPGRVAGLSIEVEPGVLRAAPGATAWVYVTLEDRSGNPITDEEVSLTASEGWIGPMRVRSDGSWIAEYVPMPAERPREVEITAETETLRTSAHLEVAPRVVRVSVGPSGGVISNLRGITAPLLTIDSDLRLRNRLVGEALMVRVGAARYAFRGLVTTGLGAPARLDNTVYAFTVGALFRRDRGRFGVWGGGGLVAAVQDLDLWFGNEQVSQGFRVAAGPAGIGGVGGRALGGELLVNGQASWLPTSGGEAGFTGNVGGFAIGAGYRLVF